MRRLVLALTLAGCVGPTLKNRHEGQFQLTFHNEAGGPVCGLYVYPFGQDAQGTSWIPAGTELPSGLSIAQWLAPTTYQVHATPCPYERQQIEGYEPSVILNADGVVALYREDDPRSKDAAQAIVHAHANGTLIPAKLSTLAHPSARPATVPAAPAARGGR